MKTLQLSRFLFSLILFISFISFSSGLVYSKFTDFPNKQIYLIKLYLLNKSSKNDHFTSHYNNGSELVSKAVIVFSKKFISPNLLNTSSTFDNYISADQINLLFTSAFQNVATKYIKKTDCTEESMQVSTTSSNRDYTKDRIFLKDVNFWVFCDTQRKRNLNINNYKKSEIIKDNSSKIYLVYGQSNTANSGQKGYVNSENVNMLLNGKSFLYEEPALGATGTEGSVWGRVGDKLILKSKEINRVYFALAGWGGKTIYDLNTSPYIDFYIEQLKSTLKTFGKIDGILFQQGEANHPKNDIFINTNNNGLKKYDYYLKLLLNKTREYTDAPFWIAKTSACAEREVNKNLVYIQNNFIENNSNVFHGPNTDFLILSKFRLDDGCHFSSIGLDAYSDAWVKAILNPT